MYIGEVGYPMYIGEGRGYPMYIWEGRGVPYVHGVCLPPLGTGLVYFAF